MAHTHSCTLIHIVFSTKERKPILPEKLSVKFHQYLVGIARNHQIEMLASGGTADHVHALVALPTTMSVSDAARVLKANSSRWVSEHGVDFAWQEGYGAFSVSPSQVPVVKAYIARQEEHHRKSILVQSSWNCCDGVESRSIRKRCRCRPCRAPGIGRSFTQRFRAGLTISALRASCTSQFGTTRRHQGHFS